MAGNSRNLALQSLRNHGSCSRTIPRHFLPIRTHSSLKAGDILLIPSQKYRIFAHPSL